MNHYLEINQPYYYWISKKFIIIALLIISFSFIDIIITKIIKNLKLCPKNKTLLNAKKKFNKWIVFTAVNKPSYFLINLEKTIKEWKIVIIGTNETDDTEWDIFCNSKNLIYLSLYEQLTLNYTITSHLKENSYSRKSIGYLFAIQHGAEEIYEMDEDLEFNNISFLGDNFENSFISYGMRNDSVMINPYPHFGEANAWPRGYKINNLGKQMNNKNIFYYTNSTNFNVKPLIFQGLINKNPDIDSFFLLTSKRFENTFNFNLSGAYPLIYFPNSYVPINSKNTRYLYNIFPFLIFPFSIDEKISDIWRGYIMQFFAWRLNGSVIYYSSDSYKRREPKNININFINEKKNYFELENLFEILNTSHIKNHKPPLEAIIDFINDLVNKKIFEKNDINIYKSFENDLINVGYKFSYTSFNEIKILDSNYLKVNSEFKLYIPSSIYITKNKNFKLINHFRSNFIYKDILLIINYNHKGFLRLNEYILSLYKKHFPNIVFIYPGKIKKDNVISCEKSHMGFFSYICFKKVYLIYPNYKGYLFINDDVYLKTWELMNLDFNIPWLYQFHPIHKYWFHYYRCYKLYNILGNNIDWKNNIVKLLGFFDIIQNLSDLFYLPNYYASKLSNIFDFMLSSNLFIECVVPTSMGILLASKYEIIYINELHGKDRDCSLDFLYSKYEQISIHPIKLSNKTSRIKVSKYNYFINGKEY